MTKKEEENIDIMGVACIVNRGILKSIDGLPLTSLFTDSDFIICEI